MSIAYSLQSCLGFVVYGLLDKSTLFYLNQGLPSAEEKFGNSDTGSIAAGNRFYDCHSHAPASVVLPKVYMQELLIIMSSKIFEQCYAKKCFL